MGKARDPMAQGSALVMLLALVTAASNANTLVGAPHGLLDKLKLLTKTQAQCPQSSLVCPGTTGQPIGGRGNRGRKQRKGPANGLSAAQLDEAPKDLQRKTAHNSTHASPNPVDDWETKWRDEINDCQQQGTCKSDLRFLKAKSRVSKCRTQTVVKDNVGRYWGGYRACTSCRNGWAISIQWEESKAGECIKYDSQSWNAPKQHIVCTKLDGNKGEWGASVAKDNLCTKISVMDFRIGIEDVPRANRSHFRPILVAYTHGLNDLYIRCNTHKQVLCRGNKCGVRKQVSCGNVCGYDKRKKSYHNSYDPRKKAPKCNSALCTKSDNLCLIVAKLV